MSEEKEPFSFPEKLDPYTESIGELKGTTSEPVPKEILNARIAQAQKAQNFRQDMFAKQARYKWEKEKGDASFQRIKESFLIVIAVVAASIALNACWSIASNEKSSDDAKKAAIAAISSVLTSTMSGIGGYLAGKKSS